MAGRHLDHMPGPHPSSTTSATWRFRELERSMNNCERTPPSIQGLGATSEDLERATGLALTALRADAGRIEPDPRRNDRAAD
jgi:hypothetical protein